IQRLRIRFGMLFIKALEKQVVLKNVMKIEDWYKIAPYVKFDFVKDNFFIEYQEQHLMATRNELVIGMAPIIGRFYSNHWVRVNILKQTESEIEQIDKEILEEQANPQYATPIGADAVDQDDPENPAVIADQGSIGAPANQKKPKANGKDTTPTRTGKPKTPKQGTAKNFKSVGNLLAKNT